MLFADGTKADCGLLCDLMHLEGAESLGTYEKDFYKGMPAVTRNTYGKGAVYYVGTRLEEKGLILGYGYGGRGRQGNFPVHRAYRSGDHLQKRRKQQLYFLINFKDQPEKIPEAFVGNTDLLTEKSLSRER